MTKSASSMPCDQCKEKIVRFRAVYRCTRCDSIVHRRCVGPHRCAPGEVTYFSPVFSRKEADSVKDG